MAAICGNASTAKKDELPVDKRLGTVWELDEALRSRRALHCHRRRRRSGRRLAWRTCTTKTSRDADITW
jgi:hypothetical protein